MRKQKVIRFINNELFTGRKSKVNVTFNTYIKGGLELDTLNVRGEKELKK